MCLAIGKIFENAGFPKETRQKLPFIEKYTTFIYIYELAEIYILYIYLVCQLAYRSSIYAKTHMSFSDAPVFSSA